MAVTGPDSPRFIVVPHRRRRRWLPLGLVLLWLGSLLAVGYAAVQLAAPELAATLDALGAEKAQANQTRSELAELRQQVVTLRRSDQISRSANTELQATLAERDEEISGLRADIDFYEHLVGATGQRRGLSVHDAVFAAEKGGSWRYTVTLTQNLNRAVISKGELRLSIEGVSAGRLRTLDWNALRQIETAPVDQARGQAFSFRYFQQLEGSIVLPKGFTPQRVHVQLHADGATVEQAFAWKPPAA